MNFATTKERIVYFIEQQGVTTKEFLEKTTIKRGFLDSDKLKATVSDVFLAKIIAVYSEINLEWLITGNGSMLKELQSLVTSPVHSIQKANDALDFRKVPLFNLEKTIGIVPMVNEISLDEEKIIDYISIPNIPSSDGAIYATGDSMHPVLKAGDIITYKKIDINRQKIFFGDLYLLAIKIDDSTTMKTIKLVQQSDLGDDYIKLVSHNQQHPAKDVHLSEITAMGLVRVSIRLHN